MAVTVTTPVFRGSYVNLFQAKENKLSKKMEFSITALFKKGENLTILQRAVEDACVQAWGEDKTKWPKKIRSPFRLQEERAKDGKLPDGHEAGAVFITLKSERRPGLVDQNVQEILDEHKVYSGAYFKASVTAFAYPRKGTSGIAPGVSFGLSHVQLVRDGDPLSGRPRVEDAFQPVEDTEVSDGSATSMFT